MRLGELIIKAIVLVILIAFVRLLIDKKDERDTNLANDCIPVYLPGKTQWDCPGGAPGSVK